MDVMQQLITELLAGFHDPLLETDLISAQVVKAINVEADSIEITLEFGFPIKRYAAELKATLISYLMVALPNKLFDIKITEKITAHAVQQGLKGLPQVKNIIAVASGKGGVGKSTVAVNLALALQAEGAKVGLLDADIYGPSQPTMLGATTKPEIEGQKLLPVVCHGIQSMSIGYLIEENTPMVWRGPMVTRALEQLLFDTLWQDLDYLIIDLPPGTGDIQLTLAQKIPLSGAVIVTTPQEIALLDARKALQMFKKVQVPVLGIIENMAYYKCPCCDHRDAVFGENGGEAMAQQYGVKLLGRLPLASHIRQHTDEGRPTVIAEPESETTKQYCEIGRSLAAILSRRAKNYASRFPKIVIESA